MGGESGKFDEITGGEPQLPAFRFRLKHLFWLVALLAALFSMPAISAPLALATWMIVLIVALHVAGTAIGTRLRDHANQQRAWESRSLAPADLTPFSEPRAATVSSAASALHVHGRAHDRITLVTLCGAILGGLAGLVALLVTIGERATLPGIAVGAISTAVVGAWLAFIAVSSWLIFRRGWREAVAESHKDRAMVSSRVPSTDQSA